MDSYEQRKELMHLDKFFIYTAFDVVGEALCSKPFGFLKEGKDVNNAIATNFFFQELVTWASHLRELHYLAVNPIMTWLSLTPASWLGETAFAAVKEALRIHCPIPMTLPRLAPRGGIEIGGRWFPEGITLSGSPWVLHRSRALWGDGVNDFTPFGAGFTSCPGQHLARIEALKIMATIIRDYDLRLLSPEKEWECKMCFAQVPHSWPVYVSKRQRAKFLKV